MTWDKRLAATLADKGWSAAELARRSSLSYQSIQKYLQGAVEKPRGNAIEVLAKTLGVDALWLEKGVTQQSNSVEMRAVEVIGHVQAGYWTEAFEWDEEERYTVPVPADKELAAYSLYGAEMRGTSMNKWRPEGTVIVFTNQIETQEEMRLGSRYVVERSNGHDFECTVKTLWQDDQGDVWLVPESSDPRFQEPLLVSGQEEETIRIMGRVAYSVSREA